MVLSLVCELSASLLVFSITCLSLIFDFSSANSPLTTLYNKAVAYLGSKIYLKGHRLGEVLNCEDEEFEFGVLDDGGYEVTVLNHKTGKKSPSKLNIDLEDVPLYDAVNKLQKRFLKKPQLFFSKITRTGFKR